MSGHILVFTTVGTDDDASKIAEALVERRLAACVNIIAPIRSVYRWKGAVERDTERLLIIKTVRQKLEGVREGIAEIHPYELPEVVAIAIEAGDDNYLNWITASVSEE